MDRSCHIAQAVVVPLVTNDAAMVPVRLLLQSEKPSEVLPNFLNLVSYGTLQHAESIPVLCAQVWYCWCVCVCVCVCACVCVCVWGGGVCVCVCVCASEVRRMLLNLSLVWNIITSRVLLVCKVVCVCV